MASKGQRSIQTNVYKRGKHTNPIGSKINPIGNEKNKYTPIKSKKIDKMRAKTKIVIALAVQTIDFLNGIFEEKNPFWKSNFQYRPS
jgi:hypothetical protein